MTGYQCKIPYIRKNLFFCTIISLLTINNQSMVFEIFVSKYDYSLKIISRNTFPEPQTDSASQF